LCYNFFMVVVLDARGYDHQTLEQMRIRAIESVQSGVHPVEVARVLGVQRQVVYKWLAMYRAGGWDALRARPIPGRPPKLNARAMKWIYETIVSKNPRQLKFTFALWTREIIRTLIARKFKIELSLKSVGKLLAQLGLSVQRPLHVAYEQDSSLVRKWLKKEFPRIKERAKREKATIFFGDEAGIRSDYHSGTTWGAIGETPIVRTTGQRVSCNMISAISAKGEICFMVITGCVNAGVFIEFLKRLITRGERKIFLIVDGHPSHRAKKTKRFVDSVKERLELFFLPPYSPELNPDELVWNHVKNHRIGRMVIEGKDNLLSAVRSALYSLSKMPEKIQGFFRKPSLLYAA
jgi:transposase